MISSLMNNGLFLGGLCYALVVVPVIGIQLIHEHGWQHWQPFDKGHK